MVALTTSSAIRVKGGGEAVGDASFHGIDDLGVFVVCKQGGWLAFHIGLAAPNGTTPRVRHPCSLEDHR